MDSDADDGDRMDDARKLSLSRAEQGCSAEPRERESCGENITSDDDLLEQSKNWGESDWASYEISRRQLGRAHLARKNARWEPVKARDENETTTHAWYMEGVRLAMVPVEEGGAKCIARSDLEPHEVAPSGAELRNRALDGSMNSEHESPNDSSHWSGFLSGASEVHCGTSEFMRKTSLACADDDALPERRKHDHDWWYCDVAGPGCLRPSEDTVYSEPHACHEDGPRTLCDVCFHSASASRKRKSPSTESPCSLQCGRPAHPWPSRKGMCNRCSSYRRVSGKDREECTTLGSNQHKIKS